MEKSVIAVITKNKDRFVELMHALRGEFQLNGILWRSMFTEAETGALHFIGVFTEDMYTARMMSLDLHGYIVDQDLTDGDAIDVIYLEGLARQRLTTEHPKEYRLKVIA